MGITRGFATALLLLLAAAMPACSTVAKGQGDFDVHHAGYKERGVASWYGGEFHGRPTASGELYDQDKMTAAHKGLPLGSLVRVINAENGRHVEVWINDRGPFVNGRIIDLSYAAAERLGIIEAGTSPILLEVIRMGDGSTGGSPGVGGQPAEVLGLESAAMALEIKRGSRYSGVWIAPTGKENGPIGRRPLGDLLDERRSRRLFEQVPDDANSEAFV